MQEKKLRDALQAIIDYIESHKIDVMDSYGNLLYVAGMADKALASTTEEMEMEKLLGSLKQDRKWAQANLADYKSDKLEMDAADMRWLEGYLRALENPIKYITTQFGEEEGDADS